jgi:hypothetical protein
MEIRTLVIIGFLLVLLSSGLYFFINIKNLMGSISVLKQNKVFSNEKKNELHKIDKNVSNELADDYLKMKNNLEMKNIQTKREIETNNFVKKTVDTNIQPKKEVYLVSNNIFSKSEVPKVCQGLFNGTVATKEQLNESYNNGANWCNYGWDNNGEAYYPLQDNTNNSSCEGSKGLNGGKMPNDNIKLGALCYGVKPEDGKYSNLTKIKQDSSFSEGDLLMLENYRKKLANGGIKITPFNNNSWSRWNYKNDTLKINDKTVITNKNDSSNNPQALETNKCKILAIV